MSRRNRQCLLNARISMALCLALAFSLLVTGFLLDTPAGIVRGLWQQIASSGVLLTDYFVISSVGAALVNAGLVTLLSIGLTCLTGAQFGGSTVAMLF